MNNVIALGLRLGATKAVRFAAIALAFLPIILTAPLMDERYWFLQGAAAENFSARGIAGFGAGLNQPGRFMPLSSYFRAIHSYVGFKIATSFHISIETFQSVVHILVLCALFAALWFFVRSLNLGSTGSAVFMSRDQADTVVLVTALVFGVLANVRWSHNGIVAYMPMTYAPIAIAMCFVGAAMRLARSQHTKRTGRVAVMAVLFTLWSNFFYELAYAGVVLLVVVAWQQWKISNAKVRHAIRMHVAVYLGAFLIIFVPQRIHLYLLCKTTACYEGSQISPLGIPKTFLLNIINPLPLMGIPGDIRDHQLRHALTPTTVFLGLVAIAIVFMLLGHVVHSWRSSTVAGTAPTSAIARQIAVPLAAMGLTGALIMSVSDRAQRIVLLGNPYRQAPMVWLALSVAISTIVLLRPWTQTTMVIALALALAAPIQWSLSMGHAIRFGTDFQRMHKLYDEVIWVDKSDAGNARRCALQTRFQDQNEIATNFLKPSQDYFSEVVGIPYCK